MGKRNAFKVIGAKPVTFKGPSVPKPPTDIADLLDYSADRTEEIGLAADGLVGGTKMLRSAAAEIRRLRASTNKRTPV